MFEGDESMKKHYNILSLMMALVMMLSSVLTVSAAKDPASEFFDTMKKVKTTRQFHAVSTVKYHIEATEGDEMLALMSDLMNGLEAKVETKVRNKEFYTAMALTFDGDEVIDFNFFFNKELVRVEIPQLHDKTFYLEWKDTFKLIRKFDPSFTFPQISLDDYKKLIDFKKSVEYKAIDFAKYENLIKDHLKGNVEKAKDTVDVKIKDGDEETTYKCDEFTLSLDQNEIMTMYFEIIREVLKDDEVKAFLKAKYSELVDILLATKDFEDLGLNKAELGLSRLNFDENYDEAREEILAMLDQMDELLAAVGTSQQATVDMKIFIDKENGRARKLVQSSSSSVSQGGMNLTIGAEVVQEYIKYSGVKIDLPKLTEKNSINVVDIDESTAPLLLQEVQAKVMTSLQESKGLSKLVEKATLIQQKIMEEQMKQYEAMMEAQLIEE